MKNLVKTLLSSFLLAAMSFEVRSQTPQISWGYNYGSTSDDRGEAITLDPSGNVITVGRFFGSVDFDPEAGSSLLSSGGGPWAGVVQKLDGSGSLLWARVFSAASSSSCTPTAVVTDESGNVYIAGYFSGTVDFDPQGGTNIFFLDQDNSY